MNESKDQDYATGHDKNENDRKKYQENLENNTHIEKGENTEENLEKDDQAHKGNDSGKDQDKEADKNKDKEQQKNKKKENKKKKNMIHRKDNTSKLVTFTTFKLVGSSELTSKTIFDPSITSDTQIVYLYKNVTKESTRRWKRAMRDEDQLVK